MSIFFIWLVVTYIVVSYIFGATFLVGAVTALDDVGPSGNYKSDEIARRRSLSRFCRGLATAAPPTGILIAWKTAQWIVGWDIFFICLLSIVLFLLVLKFGPKPPLKNAFFGPDELDSKIKKRMQEEMQKLLGRVGAFKNKTKTNSSYRSADAMDELEEWLKKESAKICNIR